MFSKLANKNTVRPNHWHYCSNYTSSSIVQVRLSELAFPCFLNYFTQNLENERACDIFGMRYKLTFCIYFDYASHQWLRPMSSHEPLVWYSNFAALLLLETNSISIPWGLIDSQLAGRLNSLLWNPSVPPDKPEVYKTKTAHRKPHKSTKCTRLHSFCPVPSFSFVTNMAVSLPPVINCSCSQPVWQDVY